MSFDCRSIRLVIAILPVLVATASRGSGGETPDHALLTDLLREHVIDGNVDYAALGADRRLTLYLEQVGTTCPDSIHDTRERLAFWINAYNAFTLRLVLDHPSVTSIRDITKDGREPWDIRWIVICGTRYSLNAIEHDILRMRFHEPLIHMALVCAARSCPPLRREAYRGDNLDAQLADNAHQFLTDTTKNRYDPRTNTLYLSEVLRWYADDFVERYGSSVRYALAILGVHPPSPPTVSYLPYDWTLNGDR